MRPFPLLHRKLLTEATYLFLLCAGSLLTLLIISRAVRMRETLLGLDIGLLDMLRLFGYMVPLFLLIVIPVSCMLSVFLLHLRMGTDRELVAMRAGGISIYQLLPAPLMFATLCFAMTLAVSMELIAWGMTNFKATILDLAANTARVELRPGVFNKDFPGLTVYSRKVDPDGTLRGVLVNDASRRERSIVLTAPRGEIAADHTEDTLKFILYDGAMHTLDAKGVGVMDYRTYTIRIPLDQIVGSVKFNDGFKPAYMPYEKLMPEMLSYRAKAASLAAKGDAKGADYLIHRANRLELECHKRWTYPVACLVLALFVIPLAAGSQGVHKQTGMLITLLMFFAYYSMMSFASVMSEEGLLPPAIAMWTPNALFLILGLWGLRMTARERTPNVAGALSVIAAKARTLANRFRRT